MSVEHFGQVQVTVEEKNIAGETIQLYSSVESLNRLANAMISKTEGSYEVNGMEFTGYTATKQDSVLGAAKTVLAITPIHGFNQSKSFDPEVVVLACFVGLKKWSICRARAGVDLNLNQPFLEVPFGYL
ncbi:hypothetical protein V6N13_012074 [Hibiscus sabdariffa]